MYTICLHFQVAHNFCCLVVSLLTGLVQAWPKQAFCLLVQEIFGSVIHMIVGERGHEVVAVVVIGLHSHVDSLFMSRFLCGFDEVLG